jgi:hypothetical protein
LREERGRDRGRERWRIIKQIPVHGGLDKGMQTEEERERLIEG